MQRPLPGIYLVHKPEGVTSFSMVQRFQKALAETQGRKLQVAHGGALDPFAHGLLLVLVGHATRLFDHLHDVPKIYEAELAFGAETDTGDFLGRTVGGDEGRAKTLTPDDLAQATRALTGWTDQVPPATSNKRIGGERAYLKAHRGEEVTLPPSRVYLHDATWLDTTRVRLVARGGYYVRSFARDLGRALGCGAHLKTLHRVAIGPWQDPGPEASAEGPIIGEALLPWLPSRVLTDQEVGVLRQGGSIPAATLRSPAWRAPAEFPFTNAPVRGLHHGHLAMLLTPGDAGGLKLHAELRGL